MEHPFIKYGLIPAAVAVSAMLASSTAVAAPYIVNSTLANIGSQFDNVVTGVSGSVYTAQVVNGQSVYNYTDINGDPATVSVSHSGSGTAYAANAGVYTSWSGSGLSLSGAAWDISPSSSGSDPIPGFGSGLTFTFSSPVNAFGFEVGDWATCCMSGNRPAAIQSTYGVPQKGSGLWIAFDGGAATLPANALSANDNPGYAATRDYVNFIGAIDSSNFFSAVTFFGDGFGEYLVAGGTLRFGSVPKGSNPGGVPEPETLALMGIGLLAMNGLRRRKAA